MNVLITGGAGFIGSHAVRYFVNKYRTHNFINLDLLTYAGNLENLKDIELYKNYKFINGDICNEDFVNDIISKYKIDSVIHFAAESHVDRSIHDPLKFAKSNIIGTLVLLNACKNFWKNNYKGKLFYHVSTDEVYGSLGETGFFSEKTPYEPRSPYSASKASSDHFVRAYGETFNLPYVISNCSNNYGEFQFPEKLIPLFINNILNKKELPIYGNGENIRDWLYVTDHVMAIDIIFNSGKYNTTYNIGGMNELKNIDLVKILCSTMDKKLGNKDGTSQSLITFINDRPGHDKRYAIDCSKIKNELGWNPSYTFEKGLSKTIDWYLQNEIWLKNVISGEYMNYYKKQYKK